MLLLITVIPVALVGKIVVGINSESLQFEVQRYHMKLAQSMAERFDERLSTIVSQMGIALDAIKNPAASWEDRQKLLSALIDSSSHFGIISAVANNGSEVIKAYNPLLAPEVDKNPALISHAHLPLFQKFKATGDQTRKVTRENNFTMAELYLPFDSPIGKNALYIKMSINDLCEMIGQENIGRTGFATYVGPEGTLLSPSKFIGSSDKSLDESMVKNALSGNLGAREFVDLNGIAWVGASAPISQLGGVIFTQQMRKEAYQASAKGQRQAAIFIVITILFAIIAAILLTRSLVNPLLKISEFAKSVDLGSGRFPDPVVIKSGDEIEELAQTFNEMMVKLKGYAELQVEKLIIEQKKTEAIIFSIKDGIIMTDYQGKIQLISRMAKQILGIAEEEPVLGYPLWKYLPSPELKTACMDLLTNPKSKSAVEVKLTQNENEKFYALSAEEVRTPGKEELLGLVTVIHDITLEKEIDSMKEEFLHSITHDLRNPLTAIRGFIRLFQSGQTGPMNEMQIKMLETMDKASLRLTNMVNDILDLARLESNRLTLHIEPSSLELIAGRVIELFMPQAKGSRIKLTMDIPKYIPETPLDPNLIERVFVNLVGNATKFTPDQGSITLRVKEEADHLRCSVEDTGEGIPKDYLEKVFDKFKQVEGHFKGGAGLGLTICKRIVEAHMGKIWVESEVGKGAAFIFTLPKNLSDRQEQKAA
ncbi:MAG: Adaptive-response sensory-kinase SasA [Elusimicrobia bacterium]|nr:Adaptive-response sensory-kinase SasA [Elusimicrobiota bacterium]